MKICIPIRALRSKNWKEAEKQIKKAEKYADFLEIWLDLLPEAYIAPLMQICKKPVIGVCRTEAERGSFQGTEKERIEKLKKAIARGVKFIDIGIQTAQPFIHDLKKMCRKYSAKLIISKHFWDSTPSLEVLLQTLFTAKRLGADIIKIATFVKDWSDNALLFEFTQRAVFRNESVIVIGMGERGGISRIGCPLLGSYLTYVALNKKSKTAEGQMTIMEMFRFFRNL